MGYWLSDILYIDSDWKSVHSNVDLMFCTFDSDNKFERYLNLSPLCTLREVMVQERTQLMDISNDWWLKLAQAYFELFFTLLKTTKKEEESIVFFYFFYSFE